MYVEIDFWQVQSQERGRSCTKNHVPFFTSLAHANNESCFIRYYTLLYLFSFSFTWILAFSRGFVDFWWTVTQEHKKPHGFKFSFQASSGQALEAKLLLFNWPYPYLELPCPGLHILSCLSGKVCLISSKKRAHSICEGRNVCYVSAQDLSAVRHGTKAIQIFLWKVM